jgi:hypothetical protein
MPHAFLIMHIGNAELDQLAATAIVPALKACGLDPKRVDKHNEGGLLKTEIIKFIEGSEIVVADLTHERPNCYLEIGYVMGIDKFRNLILTAREDHYPESPNFKLGGPKIHVDLAGYDILFWHPGNLDEFRIELEKKIRRRLAIVTPPPEAAAAPLESDWFAEQRALADQGMSKTSRTAFMELSFALSSRTEQFSLPDLNKAAQAAPIHTFGWPIALYLTRDDKRPRPRSDGVVSEVFGEKNDSYDFWALRRNGDFYWRGSLFEDERRPGDIFFDSRIVRVTESLIYCGRLYSSLGLDRQRVVSITVGHVGLRGRRLSSASSSRYISARDVSHEDVSAVSFTVRLEQLESDLVPLVKSVIAPLLALFDFCEVEGSVYEELVNNFVKGKV